jgi:hypothetical protein
MMIQYSRGYQSELEPDFTAPELEPLDVPEPVEPEVFEDEELPAALAGAESPEDFVPLVLSLLLSDLLSDVLSFLLSALPSEPFAGATFPPDFA